MRTIFYITVFLFFGNSSSAQITNIPDPGFEEALIFLGIDSDGLVNGQVLTSDVSSITSLSMHGSALPQQIEITDITGIEDFLALEHLSIWEEDISVIDLSGNVNLIKLDLSAIGLDVMNIENNINLFDITIVESITSTGTFSSIDLSNKPDLDRIFFSRMLFDELDMSTNLNLRSVSITNNNALLYVNLKNGNNANNMIVEITSTNENIECIEVDDPQAVINGDPPYQWWDIDPSFMLSEDCQLGVNGIDVSLVYVFPNPVTAILNIELNGIVINNVKIYDALGKLVLEESYNFNELDVSNLNSGFLFIKITTDQGVSVKKVVKE